MDFALTTRWNAGRHTDGEALVGEILEMGFARLELGYDLRIDLVPGVQKAVAEGSVAVDSVHNFCPVPVGAPHGHPELFTLADPEPRVRQQAVQHTINTIRFAEEIGASVVVTHVGNVKMKRFTGLLLDLYEKGEQFSTRYEKTMVKLQLKREKKARRQLGYLYEGLEQLLPVLEKANIRLAIENLPTWEAMPTEFELEELLTHFNSPHLGSWHDMGHGQIRQNLGFINHQRWLERLQPFLAGMHVHDVRAPGLDHLMPPRGDIDFASFARFAKMPVLRVIEPTPRTPREDIVQALEYLQRTWGGAEED